MTWAQRLKRVFTIDIEICSECGGNVKILTHLKGQAVPEQAGLLSSVRAPPLVSLPRTGRPVGLFG